MTQEDKELLLKDLCARLPYGVKVQVTQVPIGLSKNEILTYNRMYSLDEADEYITIKPYLRPMSSMTEEEKEEMHNFLSPEGTAIYENNGISIPMNHYGDFVSYEFMNKIIQYLLKNHFDFMGLIPKGLAIEAPEGMYKKEE